MSVDPSARPVRRIKIKFGNAVVATQAVNVPSGITTSASQGSKDTRREPLARARALQGYVPPNATADDIVARLREGEGFPPGSELPEWDLTVPSATSCRERPAKRSRPLTAPSKLHADPCAPAPALALEQPAAARCQGPGRPEAVKAAPAACPKAAPASETAGATIASGESNSDQATNSQAYLPLSPDEAEPAGRRPTGAAEPQAGTANHANLASSKPSIPSQRPGAPGTAPGAQRKERLAAAPAARPASISPSRGRLGQGTGDAGLRPSTSGRPAAPAAAAAAVPRVSTGISVETQTQARHFPILPVDFLSNSPIGGTALAYNSIGPFDLQLEQRHTVLERGVDAHIEEARKIKREGDQLCHRNARVWTIKSLSKYISAALMFMEAAEALTREKRSGQSSRAGNLYKQTSDLLAYTASIADTLKGSGIGKEALRLLAERLAAICLMRHTLLNSASYSNCAQRALGALKEHHKQQAMQSAGQATAAGSAPAQPAPSPEDSTTSSLHALHDAGGPAQRAGAAAARAAAGGQSQATPSAPTPAQALPGFGHEAVAELLSFARTTARFSDFMKRSSKSFEAFLERPDVRQDQQAKLVCVHLAALCVDMGMTPGNRIIGHAREAVRTLCDDLAR